MLDKEILNSQETYEDDYGHSKQLSVEDHSPKKKFFGNMTEEERKKNKQEIADFKKKQLNYIFSAPKELIVKAYDHYPHLINAPEVEWDAKTLTIDTLLADDTFRSNLYTHLRNIERAESNS